jgi:hypothetical protein
MLVPAAASPRAGRAPGLGLGAVLIVPLLLLLVVLLAALQQPASESRLGICGHLNRAEFRLGVLISR